MEKTIHACISAHTDRMVKHYKLVSSLKKKNTYTYTQPNNSPRFPIHRHGCICKTVSIRVGPPLCRRSKCGGAGHVRHCELRPGPMRPLRHRRHRQWAVVRLLQRPEFAAQRRLHPTRSPDRLLLFEVPCLLHQRRATRTRR